MKRRKRKKAVNTTVFEQANSVVTKDSNSDLQRHYQIDTHFQKRFRPGKESFSTQSTKDKVETLPGPPVPKALKAQDRQSAHLLIL